MAEAPVLLGTVAVSLFLAYLCAIGARALHLPPLIGYLVAGVVAGPFTPGFVADQRLSAQLADIGVALLLFGVGMHFSLADLAAVWRIAVPGALLQVALSAAAGFAVCHLALGWPPAAALVLGLAFAVASTAVATRVLDARGQLNALAGRIALGWLVVQDLLMILALVVLPAATGREAGGAVAALLVVGRKLLEVGGFVAAILFVGRRLIPRILEWTARDGSRELFRLAVIVVALGVAYVSAEVTGASLALGAFFAGVVLAESDLSHQAAADSVPIQQVFTVLFFVSVGMLFDPMVLLRAPLQVAAVVLTVLLATGGSTLLILLALRAPPRAAAGVAAAMAQIGEFSFILSGVGVGAGLLPPPGRDLVLAAAMTTIIASPLAFGAADAAARRLERWPRLRRWQRGREPAPPQRGPVHAGHVIIVGHGRVGGVVAAALREDGVPYIVVEQNMALAQQVRRDGVPVVYGDAGWPEVLGAAYPETARLLIIAIPERGNVRRIVKAAREANPNLAIIVRTHSEREAEWLRGQDIERIVVSEHRTALDIAAQAVDALNQTAAPALSERAAGLRPD